MVLRIVNGYIRNRFDFFYLPIDFKTQCNLGYCYINVLDVDTVLDVYNNVRSRRRRHVVSQQALAQYRLQQDVSDLLCSHPSGLWAGVSCRERSR